MKVLGDEVGRILTAQETRERKALAAILAGTWKVKIARQLFTWKPGADGSWTQILTGDNMTWTGKWKVEKRKILLTVDDDSGISATMDMPPKTKSWKGKYKKKALVDPLGPEAGDKKDARRVLRGGSWAMFTTVATIATRNGHAPDRADSNTGVRLVRTAPPAQ